MTTGATFTEFSASSAAWAQATSRRIAYLQVSLAEEPADVREQKIAEELQRALQPIPSIQREACLDALRERFPTWEMATVSFASGQTTPSPQTPDEMVSALCTVAPLLTPERRAELSGRLAKVGLVHQTGRVVDGVALAEIQTKLKLAPTESIDPQRLGRLFAALADTAISLEQLAWSVWKTLAPRSAIRRDAMLSDLRVLLRRSLTGESETSSTQVHHQLQKSRQLIASLIASLDSAGRGFAQKYQLHFSPGAIREMVRAEGKPGLFHNPDAQAWLRYCATAGQLSAPAIEQEIQENLVRSAEEFVRGENV